MKIDLSLAPLDKDGPAKSPGAGDPDRGVMGDAFGKAVRDAEGKRSANSNEKARKAGAERAAAAEEQGKDRPVAEASGSTDVEASDETAPKSDALQALLGTLAALSGPKDGSNGQAETTAKDGEAKGEKGLVADADVLLDTAKDMPAGKDKGAMKLDVLRMETHFEPHQDGMLLVEGTAGARSEAAPATEAKTKSGSQGAAAVAAALADMSKAKASEAKAPTADGAAAAKDDRAMPPMRFDEALARLGRGAGDRSGGEGSRDGSAAAQSTLAELAARRTAAKGADAVAGPTSTGPALPTASPYNLAGQVAGPIMDALGEQARASASAAPASSDAHLRMRAGGGALKTLTIQLHPEHLGTVDVSMRLNEGRLTLELAASRSDTASMLLDDQASLRKLLEHAGFSLDDAAISVVTRDSGQVRTADSAATGSQQRETGNNAPGEGRPEARGQSGGSEEQSGRRRAPSRSSEDTMAAKPGAGSTYL